MYNTLIACFLVPIVSISAFVVTINIKAPIAIVTDLMKLLK